LRASAIEATTESIASIKEGVEIILPKNGEWLSALLEVVFLISANFTIESV
jgi:hypothetical protein